MRFYVQLTLLLAAAGGLVYWRMKPAPPALPRPAYEGPAPRLEMPRVPPVPKPYVETSMQVKYESAGPKRLKGQTPRPAPLGPVAPVLASARPARSLDTPDLPAASAETGTDWASYLRDPRMLGAVALLFLALYSILARALKRGPGQRPITLN